MLTFIGAGSVEFTRDLLYDILSMDELANARIKLHDIDPDRLETAVAIAARMAAQVGAAPTVSAHPDLFDAVEGADFCINAIAVGGHAATLVDFDVPEQYGLRQTIADTLGVGGIFRALRTFPALDRIAEAMAAGCPDAWLLNYTNPMAMNISYLAAAHPRLKAIGLCHSVYWTVHDLCEVLGVPLEGTRYRAAGVNHQAWLLDWEHDGDSLYPTLDAAIERDPDGLGRRVRVDMYRRIGLYPTETSEHSSEYVPWYLHHDSEIERLRIPIGDYRGISAGNLAQYAATKETLAGDQDLEVADATEYAPQVIHSLWTDTPRVDPRQRPQYRADHRPAVGSLRRGSRGARRHRRAAGPRRRAAARLCRAQPVVPQRRRPHRAGGGAAGPAAGAAGRDGRPERRGDPAAGRHVVDGRRDDRGARRSAAEVAERVDVHMRRRRAVVGFALAAIALPAIWIHIATAEAQSCAQSGGNVDPSCRSRRATVSSRRPSVTRRCVPETTGRCRGGRGQRRTRASSPRSASPRQHVNVRSIDLTWRQIQPRPNAPLDLDATGTAEGMPFASLRRAARASLGRTGCGCSQPESHGRRRG